VIAPNAKLLWIPLREFTAASDAFVVEFDGV
jgi:hypothetical protein